MRNSHCEYSKRAKISRQWYQKMKKRRKKKEKKISPKNERNRSEQWMWLTNNNGNNNRCLNELNYTMQHIQYIQYSMCVTCRSSQKLLALFYDIRLMWIIIIVTIFVRSVFLALMGGFGFGKLHMKAISKKKVNNLGWRGFEKRFFFFLCWILIKVRMDRFLIWDTGHAFCFWTKGTQSLRLSFSWCPMAHDQWITKYEIDI